jgi:acyl-CoA synthetase (AMP-forming)/AMP-acid ligase II
VSAIDLLERGARLNPEGEFLVAEGMSIGYAEALSWCRRLARALREHGFKPGEHAAILSGNDPYAYLTHIAIAAAGLRYIPLHPMTAPADAVRVLSKLDCDLLFHQQAAEPLVAVLREQLPRIRRYVALDAADSTDRPIQSFIGDADDRPLADPPSLDAIAFIAPTGGTTGEPKGVMISHRAMLDFVFKFRMEVDDPQPVMLAAAPMTHAAGVLAYPVMAQGGRLVLMRKPDLGRFVDLIERERVTVTFLPPTAIYRLLDAPGIAGRDFSSLRYFLYGAAPMAESRLRQALSTFGPVMAQAYGQTECHTFITFMRPQDHFVGAAPDREVAPAERLRSCGRPTLGTRIEIRDEDGRVLGPGERGEICVSSGLAMSGYYGDEQATRDTLVDGFIRTGDVGILDAEGFLSIVDRKKELVITGGFNVYPAEVERALALHPAVADCAVFGLPHAQWGEEVNAAVELKPGVTASPDELIEHCREVLGAVKSPKSLTIWESLPRSAVGKVLRREVRAQTLSGAR